MLLKNGNTKRKESNSGSLSEIFVGMNMLGGLTIKQKIHG